MNGIFRMRKLDHFSETSTTFRWVAEATRTLAPSRIGLGHLRGGRSIIRGRGSPRISYRTRNQTMTSTCTKSVNRTCSQRATPPPTGIQCDRQGSEMISLTELCRLIGHPAVTTTRNSIITARISSKLSMVVMAKSKLMAATAPKSSLPGPAISRALRTL